MTDRALLPTGLEDVLPIDAAHEATVTNCLMDHFSSYGYDRVKPPLIEFEDNLLQGSGSAVAGQTFRVMDPVSQRMLGIRPDMTVQVGRIATTRLVNAPRPLRLSYSGQVLRVKGSQLRPERQFGQAGVELIGADAPTAECEVVLLAVEALSRTGLKNLSVDLGLPALVPAICASMDMDGATRTDLRTALDRKDAAGVQALGGPAADLFFELLDCSGPAEIAISSLRALKLDGDAATLRDRLIAVYERVIETAPDLNITVDAVENRGYEYHTGVTFTFYARGARAELGRGGRYIAGNGETATGFTLFIDSLMRSLPKPVQKDRVYVPCGVSSAETTNLCEQGLICVRGLEKIADDAAEARRLGCSHLLVNGKVEPL